jgi:hypothetical protein
MLTELPAKIKLRVIQHLAADNFLQAKQIHDQWMYERESSLVSRSCTPSPGYLSR